MKKHFISMAVTATILASCGGAKTTTAEADKFDYTVEQFADLQILRYKVPEFETLTLTERTGLLPDSGCAGRTRHPV